MPACVACRMQVPAMSSEALPLATVQMVGVVEAKLTGRPEVAVALSVSGDWANVALAGLVKVIVWATAVTVKFLLTAAAGA